MSKHAFIFDLDGTITDSQVGILRSVRYALETMGQSVPEEAVLRKFLGPPLAASFMRYCNLSSERAAQATLAYRERYHQVGWKENQVYPGMRSLLMDLHAAGHYLGIATGKPQDMTERILKYFGLFDLFDNIVGPDPSNLHARKEEQLQEALGAWDGPAVMIGDRDSDVSAAHTLGIDGIAVLYGYGDAAEFADYPDAKIVRSVEELRAALGVEPRGHRGYFITFEGNDGSGKSTQIAMLKNYLQFAGFDVVQTREPGGSPLAEKIRELLLDKGNSNMQDTTEALLFAASRAQHVRDIIRPALTGGKIVLCDRFVDSSIAYQGAGKGLGMDLVRCINEPAVDDCMPDLTILLDISPQAAMQRRKQVSEVDRLEALDDAFHERVGEAFHAIAAAEPERFRIISAEGEAPDIAESIRLAVLDGLTAAGF